MKRLAAGLVLCAALGGVSAQAVDDSRSRVPFTQTDAWAMAYVGAATLMTGFGATPELASGDSQFSAELGHIPHLSAVEQRVGLGGIKYEDLNKSPVVGRARWWLGLPAHFVFELGFAPPLEVDGAKPQDLFSLALGRRLIERAHWSLSARVHGQHGAAIGDITCPAAIAGNDDAAVNPFGCLQPSRDRIALNQYGAELTTGFGAAESAWRGHATLGVARYEPEVQIRAEQRTYSNRTVLGSAGTRPYFALGVTREATSARQWRGEVLYVPLDVRRPGRALTNEPFWSLRLMLRYAR